MGSTRRRGHREQRGQLESQTLGHVPGLVSRFQLSAIQDIWAEEVGEVELVGGWAEVALSEAFAAAADTAHYQVFLTSYDAVFVFVQNRTPRSFEIHALSGQSHRLPRSTDCVYRVLARRVRTALADENR